MHLIRPFVFVRLHGIPSFAVPWFSLEEVLWYGPNVHRRDHPLCPCVALAMFTVLRALVPARSWICPFSALH